MRFLLLAILLLPTSLLFAQTNSSRQPVRLKPFAALNTSLLIGSSERNVLATATAGLQYKKWGLGFGGGVDGYWMETYPLFLQLNYQFKKRWLVVADGGLNLVRNRKVQSLLPMPVYDDGWYTSAQINYKLFHAKWISCFGGAGYSIKTYKSKEPDFLWWRGENWVDRSYQFNRATVQAVFRF